MFLVFVSVPDEAPVITFVTPKSSGKCELSWTAIPSEHHRGELLGYRVVYTVADDPLDSSNKTVSASSVGTPVFVQGLRPYTKYLLKVAGFTSKGNGNYSVVEECQTLEDG